jgi:trimethylamine--corrinoid protein Co-methyltransferase
VARIASGVSHARYWSSLRVQPLPGAPCDSHRDFVDERNASMSATESPPGGEPRAAAARGTAERRARRRAEISAAVPQAPWAPIENPLPPLALATEEQLERIESTAFRVLEELGLEFQNEQALEIAARGGAQVDRASGIVRFDRALVRECVARAPTQFRLHARNPARSLTIGANRSACGPVSSAPNVADLDRGRRPGTFADQCDLIRLHQSLQCLHLAGGMPVEALDLPAATRHLDFYRAQLTLADRAFVARGIGRDRIEDALEMIAIARGVDRARLREEPSTLSIININSPRRVDREMLAGLMTMADNGQPSVVTPFTLAGAMSPITIPGALAQQTAEALGVIAFAQMVRPGSPIVFGAFTSNVDMKSGAPAFGTPEYVKATIVGGQLARRWKLPFRSSNATAANAVDAQATWESAMSLWAALLSHANIVHHAVGWMEGGLTASFEKAVLDAELIDMMRAWLVPFEVDDEALAFEALRDVPPGGHFFGTAHTLARFETAFHRPLIGEVRNFEAWREAGSPTSAQRARDLWKRLLASYAEPAPDPAVREALEAYVERR